MPTKSPVSRTRCSHKALGGRSSAPQSSIRTHWNPSSRRKPLYTPSRCSRRSLAVELKKTLVVMGALSPNLPALGRSVVAQDAGAHLAGLHPYAPRAHRGDAGIGLM